MRTTCEHCFAEFQVKDEALGRQVRCRSCGQPFVVSDSADMMGQPAPAVKTRRSGKKKGKKKRSLGASRGKGVTIVIVSVIAVAAIAGGVMLTMKGIDAVTLHPYEQLLVDYIEIKEDVQGTLAGVDDGDSAESARDDLADITERMRALNNRLDQVLADQTITAEVRREFDQKYNREANGATARMNDEWARVRDIGAAASALREVMSDLSDEVGSFSHQLWLLQQPSHMRPPGTPGGPPLSGM